MITLPKIIESYIEGYIVIIIILCPFFFSYTVFLRVITGSVDSFVGSTGAAPADLMKATIVILRRDTTSSVNRLVKVSFYGFVSFVYL